MPDNMTVSEENVEDCPIDSLVYAAAETGCDRRAACEPGPVSVEARL